MQKEIPLPPGFAAVVQLTSYAYRVIGAIPSMAVGACLVSVFLLVGFYRYELTSLFQKVACASQNYGVHATCNQSPHQKGPNFDPLSASHLGQTLQIHRRRRG